MRKLFTMRRALTDPHLLGGLIDGPSWLGWRALLIAAMGEALLDDERAIFTEVTGRDLEPGERIEEAWWVVGRRGGKTRGTSVLAAYLAACIDWSGKLVPGEKGVLPILAASVRQAEISLSYISAIFGDKDRPLFHGLRVNETDETIELSNDVVIEVRPASFKTIRGVTAISVILDELAFMHVGDAANPDTEILNALRPSLATTGGIVIVISSPYARRGELYTTYAKHYGPNGDKAILVAQAASRTMNPSLPQSVVDKAMERDPASASAEFLAQFRSDLESYVSREVVEAAVMTGRHELPPVSGTTYFGAIDPAGGSGSDAMTMAISHRDRNGNAILDAIRIKRPKFSPAAVVQEFAELLKSYGIRKVIGDHWGGEFVKEPMRLAGVTYELSDRPKSDIYRDCLPLLNSGKAELLDHPRLITELCGLERRTARSGKDSIDHVPGGHDDAANSACLALLLASSKKPGFVFTPEMLQRFNQQPHQRGTSTPYENSRRQGYGGYNPNDGWSVQIPPHPYSK